MESQGIYKGTLQLLERAMDLRSTKHNVVMSNIANMDTPNYKAFDVIIELSFSFNSYLLIFCESESSTSTITFSRYHLISLVYTKHANLCTCRPAPCNPDHALSTLLTGINWICLQS